MNRPVGLLLVDDNDGIRQLVRTLAERDVDLRVLSEAADGSEAIELAGQHQPDIVILDVNLPVLDGIRAIAGILEAAPGARIIMYSAFVDERERALDSGAHGWVSKGESWDTMRELITELVAGSASR